MAGVGRFETAVAFLNKVVAFSFFLQIQMRIYMRLEGKRKKMYCIKTVHLFTIVTIIFTVITVNYNNILQLYLQLLQLITIKIYKTSGLASDS